MIERIGIRTRIAGGSVVIAALLALVAGLIINAQIQAIVRDGTSDVLESDAASYVTALLDEPDAAFDRPGPDQLVAVVTPAGKVPVMTLPTALRPKLSAIQSRTGSRLVTARGQDYIVRSVTLRANGGIYHVVTARSAHGEAVTLGRIQALLVGGLSALVLAIAVTAWILTGASLAPVRRLRATADRLSTSDSSELLPVGAARDDISALAVTLNGLIERLRDAADRERQLVSDASHELRTPLAILRAQLDVATANPRTLRALQEDLIPVSRNVDRLSRLMVSLLELSRIESAPGPAASSPGSLLLEEIEESVERMGYQVGADGVELTRRHLGPPAGADTRVGIGLEDLGRVLDNLISNSLRAVGPVGKVEIVSEFSADHLQITVQDTGGGMSEPFVHHALERFSREDEARSDLGGAGLGLPIVAAIVRRSGGTIRLDNRPGTGLAVVVRIPTAVVSSSDSAEAGSV